jgi:hypothetical protein
MITLKLPARTATLLRDILARADGDSAGPETRRLIEDVTARLAAIPRPAPAGAPDARILVETYYSLQRHRIRLGNQIAAQAAVAPVVREFYEEIGALEERIPPRLGEFAAQSAEGQWALAQAGIGPVLAGGLAAHIDITRAPTAGHIWRFAGLDPTVTWDKGEKRPWNAKLKTLCWKIGDSFVKVSGRDNAYYGRAYRERKEYELARDERGGNAECAAETLRQRNITDKATRAIYESGHLPPGRLDLRARRWAVKLFLSHYHDIAWEAATGKPAPLPYPILVLGHTHILPAPGPRPSRPAG